jgi:4-aminobutyrate aminotransferase-like enzyme
MRAAEPRSMGGQPPIVWDHGEGACVSDPYGNTWLDFSSGVLVTACGHGRPEIVEAVCGAARQGLYHAYAFPTEVRVQLEEMILSFAPAPLTQVFLLTTGSEATECCIKLARTQGMKLGGSRKSVLVTFTHAFHGRTMGSQWAGGIPGLKAWMGDADPRFVQVPYPDGFRQPDVSFDVFERSLSEQGIGPQDVCGVMSETFQGANATLIPVDYAQALRRWCDAHGAVLIFDEVQAAFGRAGKPFGFQHLGVTTDLAACGKGISGGMPLSAVIGTEALMGLYGPGEMTSTHSANPVCSAAALANLRVIRDEGLIDHAARLEPVLRSGCEAVATAARGRIGRWDAVGLVAALQFALPGTTDPDPDTAWRIVKQSVQRGLMLFAPVGVGGGAVKICPPLVIEEEALREGLAVLREVADEVCSGMRD